MNLDALLEPIPAKNSKQPCKVGRILASLEEPYKSALTNHISTTHQMGGLTDEGLTALLEKAGFPIGATTVRTHRKALCTCE